MSLVADDGSAGPRLFAQNESAARRHPFRRPGAHRFSGRGRLRLRSQPGTLLSGNDVGRVLLSRLRHPTPLRRPPHNSLDLLIIKFKSRSVSSDKVTADICFLSLSLYPQRASFNIFVSLFLTFGRLVFSIKKFLRDSAVTRICAVAGFFVSIPVFLTGFKNDFRCLLFPLTDPFFLFLHSDIVLYTILQFPSTPAITTSIVISVGIVLCGCAMLHNIVVWQRVRHASLRFWRTNDWKLTRYRRAAQGLIVQFGLNAAGSVGHWKTSGCGQRKDHVAYSNASSHFRFECSEWQCQLEQPHARAFNPGLKNSKQKQSNNQHIQLYSLFSNSYSKWSSVKKNLFSSHLILYNDMEA